MTDSSNTFLDSLRQLPWFQNIGQPLEAEAVIRLGSWKDWTGPQDPKVEAVHLQQQAAKDELERLLGSQRDELVELWERIQEDVITRAGPVVGYNPAADAWDAPSTAVWHAAWTACLVAPGYWQAVA